jgi:hypothetical protein
MKKALISTAERSKAGDGSFGIRIAQVEPVEFPVHPAMFWVDCPDECTAEAWYYVDEQCVPMPERIPEEEQ